VARLQNIGWGKLENVIGTAVVQAEEAAEWAAAGALTSFGIDPAAPGMWNHGTVLAGSARFLLYAEVDTHFQYPFELGSKMGFNPVLQPGSYTMVGITLINLVTLIMLIILTTQTTLITQITQITQETLINLTTLTTLMTLIPLITLTAQIILITLITLLVLITLTPRSSATLHTPMA
jgi:hypothetical protein